MSVHVQVLGVDDWLVFARVDGVLCYTEVELWWEWLWAPNYGLRTSLEYHGTEAWREDWRYMLRLVERKKEVASWTRADYPLDMSDEEFTQRTVQRIGDWTR